MARSQQTTGAVPGLRLRRDAKTAPPIRSVSTLGDGRAVFNIAGNKAIASWNGSITPIRESSSIRSSVRTTSAMSTDAQTIWSSSSATWVFPHRSPPSGMSAVACLKATVARRAHLLAKRNTPAAIDSTWCWSGWSRLSRAHRSIGELDPRAQPQVKTLGPTAFTVDAVRSAGPVAMMKAARLAIETARQYGVAIALVHDTTHTGAIGRYCTQGWAFAAEGLRQARTMDGGAA